MQKISLYLFLFLLLQYNYVKAQDSSLLRLLDDSLNVESQQQLVTGTFKGTQLINLPTVESPARRSLQFLIMHRFGKLNEGAYALFGLDNASIRFGLDYGITDRFSVGIGRSSLDKAFDGSIKYKLLQQKTNAMPVSVSLYELINHYTLRYADKPYLNARYRTSYVSQLLIARKFSRNFSLQIAPSWTHMNLVPTPEDKNDVFAVSAGGRLKFTKRMSFDAEYTYLSSNQVASAEMTRSLSMGISMETGGHVFQFVFTNSAGMVAPYYLAKNTGSWGKGDIYFGFNISRSFNFKK
jgi:opacity protein-like surface antigen